MAEIGSYEAKTHLPALLRRVEQGERIVITRHGRPIAELVPPGPAVGAGPRDAIAALKRFGDGRRLGGKLTIRDLIDEGRAR